MFDLEEVLKNFKGKYYIPNDDDEVDYQQLYEQQKHRADELEMRWNELKGFLNETAMLADDKFQKVNNAALLSEAITCERIVEKMHELEEESK